MLRKSSALALAATVALSATPTFAEEHLVMVLGDGFFPNVVYIEEGDTVKFINASTSSQTVRAADGSWDTGAIGVDGEFDMELLVGMHQVFYAGTLAEVTGTVFFGEAPLE